MVRAEQGKRVEWGRLSAVERARAVAEAGEALSGGGLVVMPTETVYGVGGLVSSGEAMSRLARATGRAEGSAVAWHALDGEGALGVIGEVTEAWRYVVRRLTPGPVTLQVPVGEVERVRLEGALGSGAGLVVSEGEMLVRVPSDAVARAVIGGVQGVVGAVSASRGALPVRAPEGGWAGDARIEMTIDAGPTRWRGASTGVRLVRGRGCEVAREGVLRTKDVERMLRPTVLFVCSGNTCRSPMAAAIANEEMARVFSGLRSAGLEGPVARSAGTWAGEGAGATPEGVEAVRKLGVTMGRHSSRGLTREMALDAAVIYAMTGSHLEALRSVAPEASGKAALLDPGGRDVPDPVGGGQGIYDEAARRIAEHVRERVSELARMWIGATP